MAWLVFQQSLFLLLLAATAYVAGRLLTGLLAFAGVAEEVSVAAALGLGALSSALFLLGLLGLLRPLPLLVLGLLVHLLGAGVWRRTAARLRRWRPGRPAAGALAVGLLHLPAFLLTLYPPTEGDALTYHLPFARAFVESGALVVVPGLRFPVFPQANEILFAAGMLLASERAAAAVHFLQMALATLALFALGERFVHRRAGAWAAALWLGTPLVVWIAGAPYVDLGFTLWTLLAVGCWETWRRRQDEGAAARPWLLLAGAFAGFAAATKYHGLFFVAVLGLLILLERRERGVRPGLAARLLRGLGPLAAFAAAAAVTAGPWYVRNAVHTGNPLHPFFASLFGSGEWGTLVDGALLPGGDLGRGLLETAARATSQVDDFLLLPWIALFDRARFHYQAPISPAWLLVAPLLALLVWRHREARRRLLLAVAYAACCWFLFPQEPRYLLPAAALAGLSAAAVAEERFGGRPAAGSRRGWWRKAAAPALLAAALAVWGPLYGVYKLDQRGRIPITRAAREEYLALQVPGYSAVAALNRRHGEAYTVYALGAPHLRYHARGLLLGDFLGPARYELVRPHLDSPADLSRELRRRFAADFLLVERRGLGSGLPDRPGFERSFQPVMTSGFFDLYRLTPPGSRASSARTAPPGRP